MAEADGQEKTEQPTSKKLDEARDEGQVAKSMEINTLAVFGAGLTMVFLTKGFIGSQFFDLSTEIFKSIDHLEMSKTVLQAYFIKWILFLIITMAPVLLGIMVFSLIANIAQVGFKFKLKPLKPKFSRFNPVSGLKNLLFSPKSMVELGKSLVKLFIVSLFTYFIVSKMVEDATNLVQLDIEDVVNFMLDAAFTLTWKISLLFVSVAAVDFVYQRFKFRKDMMMTKQEVKEEIKQTEGDPKIKAQIRKIQLTSARKRMMKEIPTADVIITNPTHVAVAVKYNMTKDSAPKVVAKGLDELAQRIKKIAAENNVPLHEDVALARALYKSCEVGDEIPANLFKAVAQILAYIFQLRKTKKQRSIV